MKSSFLIEILDETTIEVEVSFRTAVDRLRAQQGVCRNTDGNDNVLEFLCNKKGRFKVYNRIARHNHTETTDRVYYTVGEVVEEDGKTKVKIYSVHDRSTVYFRYCSIVGYLLAFAILLPVMFLSGDPISPKSIIVILLACLPFALIITLVFQENQHKTTDLEIMKKEIVRRVEAIERWDD